MASFVRKNLLVIKAFFNAPEGWSSDTIPPQPSSAVAVVRYCTLQGSTNETSINLTLGGDGVTWSGTWDSSVAGPGRVDWVVYSSGGVEAASQGSFVIQANSANRTVA